MIVLNRMGLALGRVVVALGRCLGVRVERGFRRLCRFVKRRCWLVRERSNGDLVRLIVLGHLLLCRLIFLAANRLAVLRSW